MTISFKRSTGFHFVYTPSFSTDSFKGFIDWEPSEIAPYYEYSVMIRFPYHVMVLSEKGEETSVTYRNDSQART